ACADDLGPPREVRVVLGDADAVGSHRLGEARPARAGIEFRVGAEQLCLARRAAIDAGIVVIPVLAGEGALGPLLATHGVLVGGELAPPLLVCLLDLRLHGRSLPASIATATGPTRSRRPARGRGHG